MTNAASNEPAGGVGAFEAWTKQDEVEWDARDNMHVYGLQRSWTGLGMESHTRQYIGPIYMDRDCWHCGSIGHGRYCSITCAVYEHHMCLTEKCGACERCTGVFAPWPPIG